MIHPTYESLRHAWEVRHTDIKCLPLSRDRIRVSPDELLVQPDHRELRLGELRHRRLRVHGELDPVALRQRV